MQKLISHIFLILFLAACDEDVSSWQDDCLYGSGATTEEIFQLDAFNSLTTTIVGNVYLSQGTPQEVKIVTHPNVMSAIKTQVDQQHLSIYFNRCQADIETLDVYITVAELSQLTLAGVGSIQTTQPFTFQQLDVTLSGAGDILLKGTADLFHAEISGVGNIRSFDLTTTKSRILISGVGDAETTAISELDVNISGVGDVYYKGHPVLSTTITGTGSVKEAN